MCRSHARYEKSAIPSVSGPAVLSLERGTRKMHLPKQSMPPDWGTRRVRFILGCFTVTDHGQILLNLDKYYNYIIPFGHSVHFYFYNSVHISSLGRFSKCAGSATVKDPTQFPISPPTM